MAGNTDQLLNCANICAAFNTRRASRAVSRFYAEALAPLDLEPTQYSLLVACALIDRITVTPLAELMSMDRSALVRNLAVLQKRNWVSIEPGWDRRTRHVALTDSGRDVLQRALPLWRKAQAQVETAFGTERLQRLVSELRDFGAAMGGG